MQTHQTFWGVSLGDIIVISVKIGVRDRLLGLCYASHSKLA